MNRVSDFHHTLVQSHFHPWRALLVLQPVFKGVKTFKNEWASKYDESVFKVDIDPGPPPRLPGRAVITAICTIDPANAGLLLLLRQDPTLHLLR